VFAGEPVIRLPPSPGRGGRAQQTALLVARALAEQAPAEQVFAVLCAASDGRDGPTDAAGGIVDAAVLAAVRARRAAVDDALLRCDAGPMLEAIGGLVTTGPTGSNLADLYLVVT
jgi:hydroxypyruvate reductase